MMHALVILYLFWNFLFVFVWKLKEIFLTVHCNSTLEKQATLYIHNNNLDNNNA